MTEINYDYIDHLYKVPKKTLESIEWQDNGSPDDTNCVKKKFLVDVLADSGELLRWRAWFQKKRGDKRHGFKLTYKKKYIVRSWDMGSQHYSHVEDRYIRGTGLHKHYYLNSLHEREVYEIPEGEISIENPDQAVLDFADECNISIERGYQHIILM